MVLDSLRRIRIKECVFYSRGWTVLRASVPFLKDFGKKVPRELAPSRFAEGHCFFQVMECSDDI